jgi:hypothetical protein
VNKFKVTEGPGKNLVYEKTLQWGKWNSLWCIRLHVINCLKL